MGFTSINDSQARAQRPRSPEEQAERTYLSPPDMINHLLLVWPVRYEPVTVTKYPRLDGKPSDAVYVDIVDLSVRGEDGQPGKVMRQAKWTQGRLIRDTKGAIGVGRDDPMLVQMTKDGDAYQIIEQAHNPGSVQMAQWWLQAHPHFQPGQDAPQYAPANSGAVPGQYEASHAPVVGGWPQQPPQGPAHHSYPQQAYPTQPQGYPVPPPQVVQPSLPPSAPMPEPSVWPPTSSPPAPAPAPAPAPYPHTPAQNATLERLRAQAARPNPVLDPPTGQPSLPPLPPPAPAGFQDEEPPF